MNKIELKVFFKVHIENDKADCIFKSALKVTLQCKERYAFVACKNKRISNNCNNSLEP